jgi:hypothetical protein
MLAQDLHGDGALPGDHVGIVERMHETQAVLFLQQPGMRIGIGIRVTGQDDLAAQGRHRVDLQLRRGGRHDDDRLAAQLPGRQRDTLRVVAAFKLLRTELRHLVVGAAQLEGKNRLAVFALQVHPVRQALRKVLGQGQLGLYRHIVYLRSEDFLQVMLQVQAFASGFRRGLRRHGGNRWAELADNSLYHENSRAFKHTHGKLTDMNPTEIGSAL